MDNRQLRHFLAIYETGSITAAARRCFISQPSLSASLGQLEDTLGARLFHRHKKGVTPTAEGERLYPQATRLQGELQALTTLFRDG
ncbi:MAG TPA: LysR family transcriptional regulator, partial [Gammaproteobacteria bacterium]|nr:LysR family transcriptional regulator [Gammaproteobacteria bacterium]